METKRQARHSEVLYPRTCRVEQGSVPVRAPYEVPLLRTFGSVAALTAKVDWQGRTDGGSFLMSRT